MTYEAADQAHDREETAENTRTARLDNLTNEIYGDHELLGEAIGDYLSEHDREEGFAYFKSLVAMLDPDKSDLYASDAVREDIKTMCRWYAIQIIDAKPARVRFAGKNIPSFLRKQAD